MKDFEYLSLTMERARNEADGKPLESNTRLFRRTVEVEGKAIEAFVVRYHNTDIVTVLPDSRAILYNDGFNTKTTLERIHTYGSSHVFSIKKNWYVRLQPDPNDPKPDYMRRSIPRPFEVLDPGPEPVKSPDGCIAGTVEDYSYEETIYQWQATAADRRTGYPANQRGDLLVARNGQIKWTDYRPGYWDRQKEPTTDYKWCPHCQQFEEVHDMWSELYNGHRWGGRGVDEPAFKTMQEMLARFKTREAWREAYLTDLRAVKQRNIDIAEWEDRNRVPFYDGIMVDTDGYAYRPNKKFQRKLAAHERRVERMQKKIDNFCTLAIKTLSKGMPMPSGGDCWYCLLSQDTGQITPTSHEHKPMGDNMPTLTPNGVTHMPNHDHLLCHIEDKYVVPSLLVNALRERGYKDIGIYLHLDMNADEQTMGGKDVKSYDMVKPDLRNYMMKRLIPVAPTE